MKKLFAFFIFLLIFTATIYSQIRLEITLKSDSLKSDEKIYIAGNQPQFGDWNPGLVSLQKINEGIYTGTFSFPANTKLEFKFTKGSWDNEALNADGSIPANTSFILKSDTSIIIEITNWKDRRKNLSGRVTGKVIYYSDFSATDVLSRNIVVWLPPHYDSLNYKYYPVLYMHDGQNIFNPATSSFGIDWQLDETADSLIRKNEIEEIIIVGIYNTHKRRTEYANTPDGYRYIKFLTEELKPFIDKTYRTLPDKANTAVGGASLGGLISLIMLWEKPDFFSKAACLSPAFKVSEYDYVSVVRNSKYFDKDIKLYIDNGGVGLDSLLQPGIDEMLEALKEKGFKIGNEIYWFKDEEAEHSEAAWAERSWRFLKYLFGK